MFLFEVWTVHEIGLPLVNAAHGQDWAATTTSRKGRGSPLSPSPCLAPLKRTPPLNSVESRKNSFIDSPAAVQGSYAFTMSDCTTVVSGPAYVLRRLQPCGANSTMALVYTEAILILHMCSTFCRSAKVQYDCVMHECTSPSLSWLWCLCEQCAERQRILSTWWY